MVVETRGLWHRRLLTSQQQRTSREEGSLEKKYLQRHLPETCFLQLGPVGGLVIGEVNSFVN